MVTNGSLCCKVRNKLRWATLRGTGTAQRLGRQHGCLANQVDAASADRQRRLRALVRLPAQGNMLYGKEPPGKAALQHASIVPRSAALAVSACHFTKLECH